MSDNPADNDSLFEGLVAASGVPVSDEEKKKLRTAYSALMELAARTRKPGRQWETRPLPFFVPKPPKAED